MGFNIVQALYKIAQENPPWHGDDKQHESGLGFCSNGNVNNRKEAIGQAPKDWNQENRDKINREVTVQVDNDQKTHKANLDNRNDTKNFYKTN